MRKNVLLMAGSQARDHGGVIFVDLRDREGVTQRYSTRMWTPRAPAPRKCAGYVIRWKGAWLSR